MEDGCRKGAASMENGILGKDYRPVRLLVSVSPNQSANSVFLSQKISTSQPKPAPAPTSEQALCRHQGGCGGHPIAACELLGNSLYITLLLGQKKRLSSISKKKDSFL